MLININGKSEEVKMKANLADLILNKGLCAERVVIEHNLCIVPRQEWQNITLEENDSIEIISFVGGG
jgi:thiamine biosynthesis protein ThiS